MNIGIMEIVILAIFVAIIGFLIYFLAKVIKALNITIERGKRENLDKRHQQDSRTPGKA